MSGRMGGMERKKILGAKSSLEVCQLALNCKLGNYVLFQIQPLKLTCCIICLPKINVDVKVMVGIHSLLNM